MSSTPKVKSECHICGLSGETTCLICIKPHNRFIESENHDHQMACERCFGLNDLLSLPKLISALEKEREEALRANPEHQGWAKDKNLDRGLLRLRRLRRLNKTRKKKHPMVPPLLSFNGRLDQERWFEYFDRLFSWHRREITKGWETSAAKTAQEEGKKLEEVIDENWKYQIQMPIYAIIRESEVCKKARVALHGSSPPLPLPWILETFGVKETDTEPTETTEEEEATETTEEEEATGPTEEEGSTETTDTARDLAIKIAWDMMVGTLQQRFPGLTQKQIRATLGFNESTDLLLVVRGTLLDMLEEI